VIGGPVFDAHFHVIDGRFPLVANDGYVPPPFTVDDYRAVAEPLGVVGGAVVAGSFQGHDQSWLVDALARLGPGFVGVAQLPPDVTDDRIAELHRAGVRAVRANLRRNMASLDEIEPLARRVNEVAGWHLELYADASELDVDRVLRLPRVVVDHLGLRAAGTPALLRLAAAGHHVKATGFGRVDLPVAETLRAVDDANPSALLFGTDLPSTRSPRPFDAADVTLLVDALGPEGARRALHDNAVALYRPHHRPHDRSDSDVCGRDL
jgi:predicted TIM-barrel fold metal-dependent hydrolase